MKQRNAKNPNQRTAFMNANAYQRRDESLQARIRFKAAAFIHIRATFEEDEDERSYSTSSVLCAQLTSLNEG